MRRHRGDRRPAANVAASRQPVAAASPAGDRQAKGVAPFRDRQTEGQRDRRGGGSCSLAGSPLNPKRLRFTCSTPGVCLLEVSSRRAALREASGQPRFAERSHLWGRWTQAQAP